VNGKVIYFAKNQTDNINIYFEPFKESFGGLPHENVTEVI